MKHWMITGAAGFVGEGLAHHLQRVVDPGDRITLVDSAALPDLPPHETARTRNVQGSLADRDVLAQAIGDRVDCVYHLATLPGRGAELDYEAGRSANLDGMITLLEELRQRSPGCRIVHASSVSVYGTPVPDHVDDETLPLPAMSYAAHKLVGEILINDYTRRNFVDGLSLRLSGIVARPPGSAVHASAFFNDVFHAAREHRDMVMPLGADITTWMMSRRRCIENLWHAGTIEPDRLPRRRNWALPALLVRVGGLIDVLAQRFGPDVRDRIRLRPDPQLEAIFHQPRLHADMAEALGFKADSSLAELVDNVFSTDES
ncbi:MAG: NAD-dependent epimerase/dehydratase family protein [Novosphingobium sp.]|jgi:nucleoside-diphosphate-sugar epimerase|nr:NAD-dependent epimerase/dehydratase family protein [Novosphingobium sp.]